MALLSLEELGLAPACQEVSVDDFSEVRECDYKSSYGNLTCRSELGF